MYRDLCRAALVSINDEQRCEEMLVGSAIDGLLFRACREDVGAYVLRRLRERGCTVRLSGGVVFVGPASKLTPEIRQRVKHWKEGIRAALLAEIVTEMDQEVSEERG